MYNFTICKMREDSKKKMYFLEKKCVWYMPKIWKKGTLYKREM